MTYIENVIIIGGGPAGLSAAIYLARAGLKPLVFAGSPSGGQLTLTSEVENFPGHDSILGAQLIEKMRKQAQKFGAKIIDQNITKANLSLSKKKVLTSDKNYTAKALIIATGAKALWLNVPGEKELRGKGVSACATCDGFFFRDKVVAVVGGGDTALEEALTLTKFAKKVYLIHRRDQFRASKIMQERVFANEKIKVIWNGQVEEVVGKEKLEGVKIRINSKHEARNPKQYQNSNVKNSKQENIKNLNSPGLNRTYSNSGFGIWDLEFRILPIDGLFVAIGHKPDTEIFASQVELDEKGYVYTSSRIAIEYIKYQISKIKDTHQNSKIFNIEKYNFNYQMITSVSGVFAAGDCVDFSYRQAATAAGMGVAAALEVERWLEKG